MVVLIGRRDECAVLDRLIGDVQAGESRALVIRGSAGAGKSARQRAMPCCTHRRRSVGDGTPDRRTTSVVPADAGPSAAASGAETCGAQHSALHDDGPAPDGFLFAVGRYAIQLSKVAGLRVIADAAAADENLVAALGADQIVPRGPLWDNASDRGGPTALLPSWTLRYKEPMWCPQYETGGQLAVLRALGERGTTALGDVGGIAVRDVWIREYTHAQETRRAEIAVRTRDVEASRCANIPGGRSGRSAPRSGSRQCPRPAGPDVRLTKSLARCARCGDDGAKGRDSGE